MVVRFLDAPEIHRPVDVKIIDKAVDRIVEVFQKKPVMKVRLCPLRESWSAAGSSRFPWSRVGGLLENQLLHALRLRERLRDEITIPPSPSLVEVQELTPSPI
jgi:hypothetical protein